MKWNKKSKPYINVGERRVIEKFLFFPKCLWNIKEKNMNIGGWNTRKQNKNILEVEIGKISIGDFQIIYCKGPLKE